MGLGDLLFVCKSMQVLLCWVVMRFLDVIAIDMFAAQACQAKVWQSISQDSLANM